MVWCLDSVSIDSRYIEEEGINTRGGEFWKRYRWKRDWIWQGNNRVELKIM